MHPLNELQFTMKPFFVLVTLFIFKNYFASRVSYGGASGAGMVRLTPLQFEGLLDGKQAVFLSKYKEVEVFGEAEDLTICDVVGLPLKPHADFYERVCSKSLFSSENTLSRNDLINNLRYYIYRDKGIYDTLPYAWRAGASNAKKELFDILSGGEASFYSTEEYEKTNRISLSNSAFKNLNTERTLVAVLRRVLGIEVSKLVVEVSDIISSQSYKLGGAIVVTKSTLSNEEDDNSALPSSQFAAASLPEPYDGTSEQSSATIAATIDEVILLSLGLQRPIYMEKDLFARLSLDASLVNNGGCVQIIADPSSGMTRSSSSATTPVLPAWDIFNPKTFISMSALEKRAVLRASGVEEIPRPREGQRALDLALQRVMDDSVRREVIRLSSDLPSKQIFETEEQALLRGMEEALEKGDVAQAEMLREQFAVRRSLRQDPTQEAGAYDRFLDQDDWYMAARRKAMAPKKKSP